MLKKSVFGTLKKHWLLCVCLVVVMLSATLTALAPAYILKSIIDNILSVGSGSALKKLLAYAFIYFAVLACGGIFELFKQTLLVIIGENMTNDIRQNLARKLNSVNASYFSKTDSGQLTSIFVNDVNTINAVFEEGLVSMVFDLFKIVAIVISMFIFSPILGGITLIIIPIVYFISAEFKKKMFEAQLQNRILVGKANNHIGQSVRTKQMIKVYALEDYMSDKYYGVLSQNFMATRKADFFGSIYSPIIRTFSAVVIAVLIVVSSINLDILGISIGAIAGAITLIESLFEPIDNFGMELQTLQSAMAGVKRLNNFFDEVDDKPKSDNAYADIVKDNKTELHFDNLSFSYDGKVKVLNNLNIKIDSGERVTFVGRTGVGKSTLFKLITGMIEGDGEITLNGVNVYSINNKLKPKIFGYVEQSFSSINGSIKDNITLANDELTSEEVTSALNFVLLEGTISSLDKGIDTEFSASLFSQGQLQLLSIARAIVYNPPILLLDEITANLDSVTEKKILEILQKASENRTILAISHRESSIIKSDKIVTLEDGKIKDIRSNIA